MPSKCFDLFSANAKDWVDFYIIFFMTKHIVWLLDIKMSSRMSW